jgi:cell shape-determining protein MreD
MDGRTRGLLILKGLIYALLIISCYILQEIPGLLEVWHVRPVLVIGAFVAIAMTEGEFYGGLYGLLGGILCDTAAFHFFGVASILFLILGTASGLLVIYLIHPRPISALLITAACTFIYSGSAYYLLYGMWDYPDSPYLFWTGTMPGVVYSALWGILLFLAAVRIRAFFDSRLKPQ